VILQVLVTALLLGLIRLTYLDTVSLEEEAVVPRSAVCASIVEFVDSAYDE